jgi:hypothetical protein
MGRIQEGVEGFFKQDDWAYGPGRIDSTLVTAFKGDAGQWSCLAYCAEEQQQVMFYSVCPISSTPEKLVSISEFIHRANYGLHVGNFELDVSDGEIRFKTSVDVEGAELTFELMRNTVYANVMQMDHYLPGLFGILHAGLTAEAAIALVEGAPTASA